MDHHPQTDVDPYQLAASQAVWNNFVHASKLAIIGIAVLLIGMAIVFV